jgi:undecaprenyl-diphosphatase
MIENLVNLDKKVFLALNHFATPGVDPVMRFLSGPVPWILFILGIVAIMWTSPERDYKNRALIVMGTLILAYIVSEQSSVHLFKEVFMRLRPCHEPSLEGQVRLAASGCGGNYGFVSTHATNAFNLAILSALLVKRRWFTTSVFAWAILVSYSRIYVGVHYPGDVLGGAILGLVIGVAAYYISRRITRKSRKPSDQ